MSRVVSRFFEVFILFFTSVQRQRRSQDKTTVELAASVGWLPPSLPPSGACLCLGSSVLDKPLNAAEGYTKPGLRLF